MKAIKQINRAFPVAMLAAVVSCSALASTQTFTDRAPFLDSVLSPVTYDFEPASGFPFAPASLASFAAGSVILTTDGGDASVMLYIYGNGFGQALTGRNNGAVDAFLPVRMTFTTPRYAVGFDDLDLTGGSSEFAIINVSFGNGAPAQRFSITDPDSSFSTAAFFGIASSDPITSIQVYSGDLSTSEPGGRANLIDNVILAQVPEPATLALVGVGAAALLVFRRRMG